MPQPEQSKSLSPRLIAGAAALALTYFGWLGVQVVDLQQAVGRVDERQISTAAQVQSLRSSNYTNLDARKDFEARDREIANIKERLGDLHDDLDDFRDRLTKRERGRP